MKLPLTFISKLAVLQAHLAVVRPEQQALLRAQALRAPHDAAGESVEEADFEVVDDEGKE